MAMSIGELYSELVRLERAIDAQRDKALAKNESIKHASPLPSVLDELQREIEQLRDLQAEYRVVERWYMAALDAADNERRVN